MSSWFDPSGIASLAKNALKEAQKTIDKALDIQDDEETESSAGDLAEEGSTKSPADAVVQEPAAAAAAQPPPFSSVQEAATSAGKTMRQSRSQPSNLSTASASVQPPGATATAATAAAASMSASNSPQSIWGSITGTFFDSSAYPSDGGPVTTPPTTNASNHSHPSHNEPPNAPFDRKSPQRPRSSAAKSVDSSSVSGSVELVSPPTTPGSSALTPSSPLDENATGPTGSSSVGVLGDTMASCSLVTSPSGSGSEQPRTVSSTPSPDDGEAPFDAADLIGDDLSVEDEEDDEEEDSRSFNTVAEAAQAGLHLDLVNSTSAQNAAAIVESTSLRHFELDAALCSSSTQLSDSTHSFEYVNNTSIGSIGAECSTSTTALTDETTTAVAAAAGNVATSTITSTHAVASGSAAVTTSTRTISPSGSALSDERSSSDIVKISSSGHTSGDDAETATSSDIEIISSPTTAGDSSSTCNSSACKVSSSMCQLPQSVRNAKATNTLSATNVDDVDETNDTDTLETQQQLRYRLAELSEVLEARELRLVDVAREAAELHEHCARLQLALDTKRKRDDCLEVHTLTAEYTHRLAALEKRFQQSIRERDALRDQLQTARTELESRLPAATVERQLKDKEFVIGELRLEGEKLSKQVLQHSNIIKKLRTKERDTDVQLKQLTQCCAEQSAELERLKRTLTAKEDVERTQIEAVHRLSGANRKLERDGAQLRSSLEDCEQRAQTLHTALEAARREVHDGQAASAKLQNAGKVLAEQEAARVQSDASVQRLQAEVESLREQLRGVGTGTSTREQGLRSENKQLLRRLEELELRAEEQTEAVTIATIPLVRQAEALQQTLNARTAVWQKQESSLQEQLERAQALAERMRTERKRYGDKEEGATQQVRRLEEQLATAQQRAEQAIGELQQRDMETELREHDERRKCADRETELERRRQEDSNAERLVVEALREKVRQLEGVQSEQRLELDMLRKQQQHQHQHDDVKTLTPMAASNDVDDLVLVSGADRRRSRDNSSPTLSVGRLSLADSLSSNLWQLDDIETTSNTGRGSLHQHHQHHLNNPFQPHNTTLLEGLQSALKQRDGENHQLQWELSRQQADRNRMMAEISTLTEQVDELKERTQANDGAAEQLTDLQRKYDALLQMYGEKVEEVQELHLDLDDVKEMYRGQIDELLRQQREAAAAAKQQQMPTTMLR